MTGDQADCLARIKSTLAPWFGTGDTPLLDGFLSGPAWVLAWIYSLYAYAKLQTRISTATDGWLDLIASDFFGSTFQRGNDSDTIFRRKITTTVFRERATRGALFRILKDLTGNNPIIHENAAWNVNVSIDSGGMAQAEILAAIESVRPICTVVNTTFTG